MPRFHDILLLTIVFVSPAAAQIEFTTYAGAYLPGGNVVDEQNNTSTACGGACSKYSYVKHNNALVFGVKGTAWLRPHVALEGDVLYTPSGATGPALGDMSGKTGIASLRLMYAPSRWDRSSVYLFAGPAATFPRGQVFDSITAIRATYGMTTSSTYWGAVFGIGLRGNRKSPIGWHVEFEDNYYEFPGLFTAQKQNDFVISVGLRLLFGGPQ